MDKLDPINLIKLVLASVAFVINITAFIIVFRCKLKQKKLGTLLHDIVIMTCILHSITNYFDLIYDFEITIIDFIKTIMNPILFLSKETIDNKIWVIYPTLYLSCLVLFIVFEFFYLIESIQLLKNPNSKFSVRGKIYSLICPLIMIGVLIVNLLIVIKDEPLIAHKQIKYDQWFSFLTPQLWIPIFIYFLYSIYAVVMIINSFIAKTVYIRKKSNKFGIIVLLIIVLSNLFYSYPCYHFFKEFCWTSQDKKEKKMQRIIILIISHGMISNLLKALQIYDSFLTNKQDKSSPRASYSSDCEGVPSNRSQSLSDTSNHFIDMIQSNHLAECFYFMLKGVLHISKENSYDRSLSPILDKHFKEIRYHKFFVSHKEINDIISMPAEIPSVWKLYWNDLTICSRKPYIIEYAPSVFKRFLFNDNITNDNVQHSFDIDCNKEKLSRCTESSGKSGSIFFTTHDRKFLFKSVTQAEFEAFVNNFIEPYSTNSINHKHTTLTRIYGAYKLRIGFTEFNFILMENILPFPSKGFLHKFDLKGSLKGRKVKDIFKKTSTKKDLDFLELMKTDDASCINLKRLDITKLKEAIKYDLKILYESNLMDYSLFIGILPNTPEINPVQTRRYYLSRNRKYCYYIGIIDYMTEYKKMKSLENMFLTIFNNENIISAVHPSLYSARFLNFALQHVLK